MSASPAFASTVLMGSAAPSATADNVYTAPAHAQLVVTAGGSGSKIDEIVFQGIGTTVQGVITVWLYDGSAYHLYDAIAVPAPTASSTAPPWRQVKGYSNLVLLNGWSLYISSTVASQLMNISAFGGSF